MQRLNNLLKPHLAPISRRDTETVGRERKEYLGILGCLRKQGGDWQRAMEWGLKVHTGGS